ncbi:hypothetical protein [Mesonia sp.]|uniref:hypothetical protein n=1 Tax=Mesonia sp. TaxID=1960830 RepID=UPI001772E415|nr:hypothetical protein [Mesonia sp.]HIB37114.1 hypothetical protein [Mesonia sp.]
MKIALIGSSEYPITANATSYREEYIYELVKGLVKNNHEVTYFGLYGSKLPCEVYSLNLESIDWSYDRETTDNVRNYAEKQHAYFEIFKYLQETEFDIIHNLSDQQIPVFTAQFLNIPTITTLFEKPKGLLQSSVKLNQTQKNYYVALNHEIANSWMGHSKINDIIYRGINYNNWTFNPKTETNSIFLFADIERSKKLLKVIEATKMSGFHLKIFGTLKDEIFYTSKLKPLFDNNIEYCGEAEAHAYKDELNKASIAVITKDKFEYRENFVLEALSSGTPVVILSENINSDYLPEMCGVQTNSDDAAELRKTFVNTTRKSRKACRDYVMEKFDFERMTVDYIDFYYKVLSRK